MGEQSTEAISQVEAFERMAAAQEQYDACPKCDKAYEGVDMTRGGDLVFLHGGRDMCSVETEVDRVE